ncbi:MAG: DUF6089 family protein [Bacteroidota bacterium]
MMKLGVLVLVFLCSHHLSGQKGLELGGWFGTSQYFGDLHPDLTIKDPGLMFGVGGRYNFDERISSKISLNYGKVSGTDANSTNTFERERNLSFASDIYDLTIQAEFNFLPYFHGSREDFYTPYLFGGFSLFSFSPKAELDGVTYNLRDFGTEGQAIRGEYSKFSRAITYGIGMKWDISLDWSMNVELGVHNTQTDYLDDVSGVYPDLDVLRQTRGDIAVALSDRSLSPGIGEPGRQRGNSQDNDTYVFLKVGFLRFFGTLPCPDVSNQRQIIRKRANTLEW